MAESTDTDSARSATGERPTTRREKWRYVRAASRRRVRGREDVAPVPVQAAARAVDDAAHVGWERVRRAVAGDRGLWLGLVGMLVVAVLILAAPLTSWLDQRDRVDLARDQLAALEAANVNLEQRSADLTNPEHVEVLAREQLGYARPGQVAYALVPPEEEEAASRQEVFPEEEPSLWDRIVEAFTN